MASDASELLDAADLESPNLNPSYSLRPDYAIRSVALTPREVFPETSSQLIAPLSTTYMPPGTQVASFAAEPGQPPVNLMRGADLSVPTPRVAPVVPREDIAPQVMAQAQVAPPVRQPTPTPGQNVPPNAVVSPFNQAAPYDPNAALQNRRDQLVKDAARARAQGTGWFNRLVNETEADKSNDEYKKIQGEIATIDQQIQTQVTNQQLSKNSGLRQKMSATADAAAIAAAQISEWKDEGNIGAYRGLQATGHAEQANIYNAEGFSKLGKDVVSANKSYDLLDKSKNENDYRVNRELAMEEASKNLNARNLGLTEGDIPKSYEEYRQRRTLLQASKNDAASLVNTFKQAQENRGVPQTVANKEHGEAIVRPFRYSNGESMPNLDPVTLGDMGGQIGAKGTGQKDLGKFGIDYHDGSPAQVEAYTKQLGTEESKDALQKFKMVNEFQKIANNPQMYKSGPGVGLVYDATLSIGRDLAEGAKAAGTVGFAKILDQKLGGWESWMNKAKTELTAYKTWVAGDGKGEEPRLSAQTIQGLKDIANYKLELATHQMGRVNGAVATAGRYGIPLDQLGLGPDEQELVKNTWEKSAQKTRLDKDSYPSKIYGDDRVYLPKGTTGEGVIPPGSYKAHIDAVIEKSPLATPPPVTGFPAAGAPAVPFMQPGAPPPPARPAGGALRPLAATPAASLIQSMAPQPAPAASVQTAQAQLPSSWGVGAQPSAGALPATSPLAVQPSAAGGGAGSDPRVIRSMPPPTAPVTIPNHLRGNPIASTVYTTAAQTARNLAQGNEVVGNNVAAVVTSSAKNESNFKPHELHDKDQATGRYAGYGLFGHQKDRLAAMQKHGGVPVVGVPGEAVAPEAQTTFYTREIMDAMKKDPFIKATLENPNASAEDLTRVQMRMEKPEGYKLGQEEKGKNWSQRLAATQNLLLGQRGQLTSDPKQAEANYWASQSNMMKAVPQNAPAIGATVANIATTPFGPAVQAPATIAGGVAGGVAKNAMIGTPEQQTWGGYTEAGVKGGVEALPMTIPGGGWKSLAGRALTAGAVEGGIEAYDTGEIPKALNVAGGSALTSAAAETFMHALGKGFSGIYKAMTNNNKTAMENAGKILSEQKPKTMLADGTTVENKAYTTAEKFAKDKNIDPDHLAHAWEQQEAQATRREALLSRPSEVAKRQAGRDLDKVVHDVGGATPGMPAAKTRQALSGIESPVSRIDSGLVPPAFRADAETAARTMAGAGKPTPTNFGQVMDNFAQARTDLLYKRANAEAITPNHPDFARKKEITKAYDDLGQHIRLEQEKLIRATLPLNQQQPLIDHLRAASTRYRNAIMAGGDDIAATIAAGGAKGNQARTAFNNLAGKDQDAKNMMHAVTTMEGRKGKITMLAITIGASQALHAVPVAGTLAAGAVGVLSAAKLTQLLKDYSVQKGAGKIVTMKELVTKELARTKDTMGRAGATIGGSVGANAARSLVEPAPASP